MSKTHTVIVNNSTSVKISAPLFLIFLVLKLSGLITWSWWWVLSPLWIPICLFFLGLALLSVAAYFSGLV